MWKVYCLGDFPFFIQQKYKHVGEYDLMAMVEYILSDYRSHTTVMVYTTAIKIHITSN